MARSGSYHSHGMLAVGIDTAAEFGSVALVRETETLSERSMSKRLCHAEQLLPTIVDLLDANGLKFYFCATYNYYNHYYVMH